MFAIPSGNSSNVHSLSYIGNHTKENATLFYDATFTGASIGTEDADRIVLLLVMSAKDNGASSANLQTSTSTVGGIAPFAIASFASSIYHQHVLAYRVPIGVTADIFLNYPVSGARQVHCTVCTIRGLSRMTSVATINPSFVGAVGTIETSTIPPNSFVIAGFMLSGNTTLSWGGATEIGSELVTTAFSDWLSGFSYIQRTTSSPVSVTVTLGTAPVFGDNAGFAILI